MIAHICWSGLAAIGFTAGLATVFGLSHERIEYPRSLAILENRGQLKTAAVQRYVASRASHWKDIVLTR